MTTAINNQQHPAIWYLSRGAVLSLVSLVGGVILTADALANMSAEGLSMRHIELLMGGVGIGAGGTLLTGVAGYLIFNAHKKSSSPNVFS